MQEKEGGDGVKQILVILGGGPAQWQYETIGRFFCQWGCAGRTSGGNYCSLRNRGEGLPGLQCLPLRKALCTAG